MYCSNCGTKIEDQANFCTNCGQRVVMANNSTAPHPSKSNTTERFYLGSKEIPKETCDRIDSLITQDDFDNATDLVMQVTGLSRSEAESFIESHEVGSWNVHTIRDTSTPPEKNAPRSGNSQGLSTKKILCIIASALIGLSGLLPYVTVSFLGTTISKSLLDGGDGYFLIGIAIIGIIFSVKGSKIATILAGAAALGIFFLENSTISKNLDTGNELARQMLRNGAGYYCLIIGAIALIVCSVLIPNDR